MANRRHDAERRAAERGGDLGHQFLEGVFLGAEGAGEIAGEARGMARRVTVMPISA